MKKEALRMERITYEEKGIMLLNNFNLQIYAGEIMGLITNDFQGMDAVLQVLQKNVSLVYGYVYLAEQLVNQYSGHLHNENNVMIISPRENLVYDLSAAENVFILRRGYKASIIKKKLLQQQLKMILDELGIEISIKKPILKMSSFEQYALGIIKAVVSKAEIIVLKDPGTEINYNDMKALCRIVKYFAAQGNTFIYISIDRDELVKVCDRIAIMDNGRITQIFEARLLTEEIIRKAILPHIEWAEHHTNESVTKKDKVFECRDVYYKHVKGLSFDVWAGECLVIHEYGNRVMSDLREALIMEPVESGIIRYKGSRLSKKVIREIGVILENPIETMIFQNLSYTNNLCLLMDHRMPFIWRKSSVQKSIAKEILGEEMPDLKVPVKYLSIKEKYRLIYSRILLQHPKIVFCFRPFQNINIELAGYINSLIKELLEHGIAVVIIIVNIHDIPDYTNRILFINGGKETGTLIYDELKTLLKK